MKRVVIGLIGTQLDARGAGPERWTRWRPSVSVCQHEDLLVDRFELLWEGRGEGMAQKVADDIRQVSPETEVRLHKISFDKDPWDFEKVYSGLFDFAKGYDFQPDDEEYLVHITTGTHVAQICWFLLAESGALPANLLQTSPPRKSDKRQDRHSAGSYDVVDLDLSKYDALATRFEGEQLEVRDFLKSGIATKNAVFNQTIERIEQVALRSQAPIYLTGPTGAGKSHLAKRIYQLRRERGGLKGKFVEVNCATLRGDTAASTLFGHVKGSFTGAQKDRPGLLREAHGGLLFLDEIGELGADEQAMLLRALEEKTFLPVGADNPVNSDFQLIVGTNRDLREEVIKGNFREDLLARINLWTFALPALAERREDIEPNLDFELQRYREETGRTVAFNREARSNFLEFALSSTARWKGNFRDLNAAITRMATLAPRGRIRADEVDEEIVRLKQAWQGGQAPLGAEVRLDQLLSEADYQALDPFDAHQLAYVVRICRESATASEAGRRLYAESRKKKAKPNDADRLRKYLAKFGLSFREAKA